MGRKQGRFWEKIKEDTENMRTIFTNGQLYTFDETIPRAEAVVVENGKFIAVGSKKEIKAAWKHEDTKVIDLKGKTVTPGLTDSHLHIGGIASQFLNLDVRSEEHTSELQSRGHLVCRLLLEK